MTSAMRYRRRRLSCTVEHLEARALLDVGSRSATAILGVHAEAGSHPASVAEARKAGGAVGSGVPGQLLTIGGHFVAGAQTQVIFTGPHGYHIAMEATQVTASSVTVPVPIYFRKLAPASGTVAVAVQQQSSAGVMSQPAYKKFQIAKPHAAGASAERLLGQTAARLTAAIQNYQTIGAASNGRVDVTAAVAKLQGMLNQEQNMARLIAPLADHQVKQIVLGQRGGKPIVLNARSLKIIAEIVAGSMPGGGATRVMRAGAQPLDDSRDDGDGASFYDDIASSSDDLGSISGASGADLGSGTAGAALWADSAMTAAANSDVFSTYGGMVLAGDSQSQLNAYDTGVQASGLGQTEGQDADVTDDLTNSGDGATLDDNSQSADDALGTIDGDPSSTDGQIDQDAPEIQLTLHVGGGGPGIENILPTAKLVTTTSGGQTSFQIQLNSQPTGTVTVPLRVSNPSEATISPSSLTFTPDNWNVPQTVTLTGQDDPNNTGSVEFYVYVGQATSNDPSYNGLDGLSVPIFNKRSTQSSSNSNLPNLVGTYTGTYSGTAVDEAIGGNYATVPVSGTITLTITSIKATDDGAYTLAGTGTLSVPGSREDYSEPFVGSYVPADKALGGTFTDFSSSYIGVMFEDFNGNSFATITPQSITGTFMADLVTEPDSNSFSTHANSVTFTMSRTS